MRKLILACVFCISGLLSISGCSYFKSDDEIADLPVQVLFDDAQLALELGNYYKAAEVLEAMDVRYPFSPYKTQVQLDLIYTYYKLQDELKALISVERFLRLNPTHKDVDYVQYMSGLINMQADSHRFHDFVGMDRSDRDPTFAEAAFRDFNLLIARYPNSRYAPDAQKRMMMLKNRLAKHSLAIAEHYVTLDAWIAAVNRAQYLLEQFPDAQTTERALEILVTSYDELGQATLKQNAQAVLAASYPSNKLLQ